MLMHRIRQLPFALLLPLALLSFSSHVCSAAKSQNPVEDLHYANALYHYYLEQPLQSLTQLSINELHRQQQQADTQQPLDSLLLETVLKLDYGMALSAARLMQQEQVEENLRKTDSLWLHLASVFYDKQLYAVSQQALDRVNKPKRLRDYAQWLYLNAQIAMKDNNDSRSRDFIEQLDQGSIYNIYLEYNLALQSYRDSQPDIAVTQLDTLISRLEKPENKEQQLLKDRILITTAYIHFYQQNIDPARRYFSKLSTDSLFVDEALLGFGKVAAEQQQFELANQLWLRVQQHPLLSNRKIEAVLLLAESQEKQGYLADALQTYEEAEQLGVKNREKLQQLQHYYSASQLAATMLNYQQQQLDSDEIRELLTDSSFLLDVLNDQAFAAQIRNLHDLQKIDQQLAEWHQKLPAIHDIMDSKISALKNKQTAVAAQKQQYQDDGMQQQFMTFSKQLENIEQQKQVFALNSEEENERLQIIEQIKTLLPHLTDDPFYDEYVESLRRIEGAITWQAYDNYHERLWQSRKQLTLLERALQENQQLTSSLDQLLSSNQTLYQYRQNLNQQQQLINEQQAELDQIRQQAQLSLKQDFDRAINAEQQNTLNYLRHARLAIARVSEHFLDEEAGL